MLSVDIYVLGDKGRTVATVDYAEKGLENVESKFYKDPKELKGLVDASDADLIHFVPSGAVLLPDFYKAMLNYLEHSQRDYVFCPCLRISANKKATEIRPNGKAFSYGQMIVKRWVVNELGDVSDLNKLSHRIVSEYRGVEIPHCLYMEM
jgi:hypothetical protein